MSSCINKHLFPILFWQTKFTLLSKKKFLNVLNVVLYIIIIIKKFYFCTFFVNITLLLNIKFIYNVKTGLFYFIILYM